MATNPLVTTSAVVEPGYMTTEFWLALATDAISLLVLFHVVTFTGDQVQAILGTVGLVASNAIYILSRGIRKIGQ